MPVTPLFIYWRFVVLLILKFKSIFQRLLLAFLFTISFPVNAHFQMLYTPNLFHSKSANISLKMPFTHPSSSGYVMATAKPDAFYVIKKGKKTNLMGQLKKQNWRSRVNSAEAYQADLKLRGLGDSIFIYNAAPYFEKEEELYIQQFTKTIVNVGDLPTDWDHDLGLTAEIVPLTKPYAIYEGGIFSGVVKADGHAVAFAEVEVTFVNYLPDIKNNRFAKYPTLDPSAVGLTFQTFRTDASGTFHFSLLKAGIWGFSAIGVGAKKTYKGKALSQDAIIWVQAKELATPKGHK